MRCCKKKLRHQYMKQFCADNRLLATTDMGAILDCRVTQTYHEQVI